MIPLYSFLNGDSLCVLLFAYDQDTMADLIAKAQAASQLRVKAQSGLQLIYNGKKMANSVTVAEVGFRPLDIIKIQPGLENDLSKSLSQ